MCRPKSPLGSPRPDPAAYDAQARKLAAMFVENFRRFEDSVDPSIVAAGPNACVLHYRAGDAELRDGELVLIDAGCELDGYASDITRTFPVNGRFTPAQRDVYEIVLASQAAAIAKTRAGNRWNEPHDAAVRVLAQGMLDLKLLQGSLDEVLEKLGPIARVDTEARLDGRNMTMVLSPDKKAAANSKKPAARPATTTASPNSDTKTA
mgnify:CR=1 FL=1